MRLSLYLALLQLVFPLVSHCYYGPPTNLETQAFVSLTIASISPATTKNNHYSHTVGDTSFYPFFPLSFIQFSVSNRRQPITRTRSLSTLDASKCTDDLRPSVRCYRYVGAHGWFMQLPFEYPESIKPTDCTKVSRGVFSGTHWSTKSPNCYHVQTRS